MGTKGGKLSMKTKTLLELANQIENKNLLSKLMECGLFIKMSSGEQEEIIEAIKLCKYNIYAIRIAVNPYALELRTTYEQIKLIEAVKSCEYNEKAFELAVDSDMLELRTLGEQIKLIEAVKTCEYNEKAFLLAINRDVLATKTLDEQIDLMKKAVPILSQSSKPKCKDKTIFRNKNQ